MPWDGDPNCFALRVRGDSMIGAAILDGDLVVVRPQQSADDGQIVVALLEDEATVKRFRRQRGRVWLQPENPNYMPCLLYTSLGAKRSSPMPFISSMA